MEVGSGSGYVLALLSRLVPKSRLYGVEIVSELAAAAKEILKGHKNIKIFLADNNLGLPTEAPFDRILVSVDAGKIPEELFGQLAPGGIMVCPIGDYIFKFKKWENGEISSQSYFGFTFVPLIRR